MRESHFVTRSNGLYGPYYTYIHAYVHTYVHLAILGTYIYIYTHIRSGIHLSFLPPVFSEQIQDADAAWLKGKWRSQRIPHENGAEKGNNEEKRNVPGGGGGGGGDGGATYAYAG